ncbi:MAG: Zn-dependent oligopeptidase [Micromonosporaceae bacterium]|nr:Zn-dependent oligopeptidase [Micromonosporaceae bacterium]
MIAAATEEAIARARAGFAAVKSGTLSGLDRLDAYDDAMAVLANTADPVDLVAATHPDEATRTAAEAAKQRLATVRTEASLDRELYDALASIDLETIDDPGTRHYLAVTLREFRRAGVDRDEATRARVRELQEELVTIGQAFDRNIRTDTRAAKLPVQALDGLPEDYVRAHPPGPDGLVTITTDYPDILPFLSYARDAGAREQLWRLFRQRGHPANVEVLRRMLQVRHELATLLGYPSWAQYAAENKMIGSAENIAEFIERIAEAARGRAERDYERLLARKRVDDPEATMVAPWDASYLDDRIKAEQLAFDTQALRPYFEYGRVKAGLMALVERLFAVRFVPRPDIPVWHPEVECFEVQNSDGTLLGRIFLDMHPRPDKYSHAAMFPLTTGKAGQRIPECALVCNLPRPSAQEPALLRHSDVETLFHEFGHLLHHIFAGAGRWAGTSGIATEWDFVEAPSQLLEEWVRDPEALATFAVHYETGEPLPASMVAKLREAEELGKGLYVRQQMFYASLSLNLYRRDPADIDPVAVEREEQERLTPYKHVDGTFLHLGFGHLDGYSALYCTYMWSLVIAKDLFTVFARDGLLNPEVAVRYRDAVLAPGGTAPAAELIERFLGRPYSFDAYRAWLDSDTIERQPSTSA